MHFYWFCYFCRSGGCGKGVDHLRDCDIKHVFKGLPQFYKLPDDYFNGEVCFDTTMLKRQNSLAGNNATQYFISIFDELIEYGKENSESWLSDLEERRTDNVFTYEEVCFILQLRHLLSI